MPVTGASSGPAVTVERRVCYDTVTQQPRVWVRENPRGRASLPAVSGFRHGNAQSRGLMPPPEQAFPRAIAIAALEQFVGRGCASRSKLGRLGSAAGIGHCRVRAAWGDHRACGQSRGVTSNRQFRVRRDGLFQGVSGFGGSLAGEILSLPSLLNARLRPLTGCLGRGEGEFHPRRPGGVGQPDASLAKAHGRQPPTAVLFTGPQGDERAACGRRQIDTNLAIGSRQPRQHPVIIGTGSQCGQERAEQCDQAASHKAGGYPWTASRLKLHTGNEGLRLCPLPAETSRPLLLRGVPGVVSRN